MAIFDRLPNAGAKRLEGALRRWREAVEKEDYGQRGRNRLIPEMEFAIWIRKAHGFLDASLMAAIAEEAVRMSFGEMVCIVWRWLCLLFMCALLLLLTLGMWRYGLPLSTVVDENTVEEARVAKRKLNGRIEYRVRSRVFGIFTRYRWVSYRELNEGGRFKDLADET